MDGMNSARKGDMVSRRHEKKAPKADERGGADYSNVHRHGTAGLLPPRGRLPQSGGGERTPLSSFFATLLRVNREGADKSAPFPLEIGIIPVFPGNDTAWTP
jgi:hypothetical protein